MNRIVSFSEWLIYLYFDTFVIKRLSNEDLEIIEKLKKPENWDPSGTLEKPGNHDSGS